MSNISLSLPEEQLKTVDTLINRYGFANRSEFIRSMLRMALQDPSFIRNASVFPFKSPSEKSVHKIMADFTASDKYSKEFLNDLEEGLKASDYFEA